MGAVAWMDEGGRKAEVLPGRRILSVVLIVSSLLALGGSLYTIWQGRSEYTSHLASPPLESSRPLEARHHWVDTWAAVPQSQPYEDMAPQAYQQLSPPFHNLTMRQSVSLTIGADKIRLRLSNAFGSAKLPIARVTVALPSWDDTLSRGDGFLGSRNIDIATLREVTFSGNSRVVIPDGALAVSDPINFDPPLPTGQVLTISMYLRDGHDSGDVTTHRVSLVRTLFVPGDQVAEAEIPDDNEAPHWFFVSAVEAWKEKEYRSLVVIGDSITDGAGSHMNTDLRWPSQLFRRMQASENANVKDISVINQGAAGNQLLTSSRAQDAPARLDRDVLAHSGVKYVLIFEGVNDIGHGRGSEEQQRTQVQDRVINNFKQIITRVHAFGIPVFGATITPFTCGPHNSSAVTRYGRDPIHEKVRLSVNDWIRTGGWFDAVIDFDAVLRDPSNHTRIWMDYNSGDCLHPAEAGHRRLAEHFPLELFELHRNPVEDTLH